MKRFLVQWSVLVIAVITVLFVAAMSVSVLLDLYQHGSRYGMDRARCLRHATDVEAIQRCGPAL